MIILFFILFIVGMIIGTVGVRLEHFWEYKQLAPTPKNGSDTRHHLS